MGMTIPLQAPDQALYGRTQGGAVAARDDAWSHMYDNSGSKKAVVGGMAAGVAAASGQRGATANEDPNLVNNQNGVRNGAQNNAIGMAGSLARGNMPSQGAYQLQRGLDQGLAQQTSVGRSARGGAALATAEDNTNANSAAMQQNGFTAGQQLRASDMATGQNLYGQLANSQQSQDQQRLQQGNDMSQFNAAANDKYALGMGAAAAGLGGVANGQDNINQNYYNMGMAPINDQTAADQQQHGWIDANSKQAQGQNVADDPQAGWKAFG